MASTKENKSLGDSAKKKAENETSGLSTKKSTEDLNANLSTKKENSSTALLSTKKRNLSPGKSDLSPKLKPKLGQKNVTADKLDVTSASKRENSSQKIKPSKVKNSSTKNDPKSQGNRNKKRSPSPASSDEGSVLSTPSEQSIHLADRAESSASVSTFGDPALSRLPSMQGSQFSVRSPVHLDIETPRPEDLVDIGQRSEGIRKELFQAARKCDFDTMSRILDEWRALDLSFVDESGKTLLHLCSNAGDRKNVEFLLKRGAPVNKVDKAGMTPLHYAARKDYVDIIELLCVHGAALDFPETKTGLSALHYAVTKNFLPSAQILLFSGADVNFKDKQGRPVMMFCRSKEMRRLLAMNSGTHSSFGQICLQTVEIKGGTKVYSDRLDVMFDYTNGPADDKFSLMCRKLPVEYYDSKFKLHDVEEMYSDVITYRLTRKGKPTVVKMKIPIFANPDMSKVELILTNNQSQAVVIEKIFKEKSQHYCIVTADLAKSDAFVIVSRPLREVFDIPEKGITVTSMVNDKIQLVFDRDTFDGPSKISLEITNIPDSDILESSKLKDIYSVTPFCSIHTENNVGPKKEVEFRLPLPEEYGVGGTLRVFTSNVYEIDDVNENSWSVVDTRANITGDIIGFGVRAFSVKVAVETKRDVDLNKLKTQVHYLFQKARLKDYSVDFFAMIKREDDNTVKMIIECALVNDIEERKRFWSEKKFEEHGSSRPAYVTVNSRQTFHLAVSKNFKVEEDPDDILLQFHDKRNNFLCLTLDTSEQVRTAMCNIQVTEYQPRTRETTSLELEAKPKLKVLSTISVELYKEEVVVIKRLPIKKQNKAAEQDAANMEEGEENGDGLDSKNRLLNEPVKKAKWSEKELDKIAKGDKNFKGFTNDTFLREIVLQLDDEWYKVVVLMGWSHDDIEKRLQNPKGSELEKMWHYFVTWRDKNRGYENLGMPILITAFSKGGRRDLCTSVQLMMREWSAEESNHKTKFYRWLTKATLDSDLMNPGDYPYPCTDQFLLLLVEMIGAKFELAEPLGISQAEVERILEDEEIFKLNEHKMLKILLMAREQKQSKIEFLKFLVAAMQTADVQTGKRWIVMACSQWLETNKSKDENFKTELAAFLKTVK